jgi:methionine-rich copper-binding protein CopC
VVSRPRRPRRLGAAAALLLLLAVPAGARAHAIVLESVPAPDASLARAPERARLRFNSKIEKRLVRVTLTAGAGAAVPLSAAHDGPDAPDQLVVALPPLGPGTYVLRYRVLAADGHITEGALRFTVTGSR